MGSSSGIPVVPISSLHRMVCSSSLFGPASLPSLKNHCLWRIIASFTFVRKIDVFLRCWQCQRDAIHRTGHSSSSHSSTIHRFDSFRCRNCHSHDFLYCFWQTTVATDDGSGESNLHLEEDLARRVLHTTLDRNGLAFGRVKDLIETEVERNGSFSFNSQQQNSSFQQQTSRNCFHCDEENVDDEDENENNNFLSLMGDSSSSSFDPLSLLNDIATGSFPEKDPVKVLKAFLCGFDYSRVCEFVVKVDLSKFLQSKEKEEKKLQGKLTDESLRTMEDTTFEGKGTNLVCAIGSQAPNELSSSGYSEGLQMIKLQSNNNFEKHRHFSESQPKSTKRPIKCELQCYELMELTSWLEDSSALLDTCESLLEELE
jgi:hypothetical protein